jgi:hypothetical protein
LRLRLRLRLCQRQRQRQRQRLISWQISLTMCLRLRSYRLLRSAALGAAASLDTAGNRVMQDIGAGANPAGSAALHHAHGERASPATCPSPRLPARRRRWFPLRFRAFFAGSMTFSG